MVVIEPASETEIESKKLSSCGVAVKLFLSLWIANGSIISGLIMAIYYTTSTGKRDQTLSFLSHFNVELYKF